MTLRSMVVLFLGVGSSASAFAQAAPGAPAPVADTAVAIFKAVIFDPDEVASGFADYGKAIDQLGRAAELAKERDLRGAAQGLLEGTVNAVGGTLKIVSNVPLPVGKVVKVAKLGVDALQIVSKAGQAERVLGRVARALDLPAAAKLLTDTSRGLSRLAPAATKLQKALKPWVEHKNVKKAEKVFERLNHLPANLLDKALGFRGTKLLGRIARPLAKTADALAGKLGGLLAREVIRTTRGLDPQTARLAKALAVATARKVTKVVKKNTSDAIKKGPKDKIKDALGGERDEKEKAEDPAKAKKAAALARKLKDAKARAEKALKNSPWRKNTLLRAVYQRLEKKYGKGKIPSKVLKKTLEGIASYMRVPVGALVQSAQAFQNVTNFLLKLPANLSPGSLVTIQPGVIPAIPAVPDFTFSATVTGRIVP